MTQRPLIHQFLRSPLSGPEIEERSLAAIDREMPDRHGFSVVQWEVVRRMIHTCGDPGLADAVRFSPDAMESGVAALRRGAAIYVDSNMIRSGLSLARLSSAHAGYRAEDIFCHVADADVTLEAGQMRLPRSLFAVRKAKAVLNDGIAVFGNAPVALLELNRMIIEEGTRPALVIGLPVGFVHVVESKEELMSQPVPWIIVNGRRGGSGLAVSAVHALCTLAAQGERSSA